MGPITLFDKSFLQSLSPDESIWFDGFFTNVICPIFYVETLANLAKQHSDRSAETAVRIIAQKTPVISGNPCPFHIEMGAHNLLGHPLPMDGRIPRSGGRYVRGGGREGIVYNDNPEMKAFARWQAEEFLEVERQFAAVWRTSLGAMDLDEIGKGLRGLGLDGRACKSEEHAHVMARTLIDDKSHPLSRLRMAVGFFGIPQQYHHKIIERWNTSGRPPLSQFAPYAAYILTVEVFFHIAIAAKLISAERASNRTDIAYLFYLPFCMIFVSSDKLHRRISRIFCRPDQEFVWGPDLKSDLSNLNSYYLNLSDLEKEQGIIKLSRHPPLEGEFLTTALWRKLVRASVFEERDRSSDMTEEDTKKLVAELRAFSKGETVSELDISKAANEMDMLSIERLIPRKKGSWYLVPKDLPDPDRE